MEKYDEHTRLEYVYAPIDGTVADVDWNSGTITVRVTPEAIHTITSPVDGAMIDSHQVLGTAFVITMETRFGKRLEFWITAVEKTNMVAKLREPLQFGMGIGTSTNITRCEIRLGPKGAMILIGTNTKLTAGVTLIALIH